VNKEFLSIIEQLQREKGVNKEVLLDAVKTSLIVAAKKIIKFNTGEEPEDVTAEIDPLTGDMCVQVEGKEFVSGEFGRIAAQTARQVIIQKIREAEKDNVYNDFKDKEGDIISGVVYRIEKKAVIVDIMGRGEGIIPNSFLSPLDNPRMGERMKAYVYEVKRDRGVQIILSRKHEGLVKKLFELEVPEIFESIVEIKSIAREAGERTKIAVFSKEEKVDCVGACVGIRGARVKSIIEELRGEKIDVVRWNDDIKEFIKEALSPATISQIELDRENKRAKVIATPEQLSLAIGKRGQNVRLASKLVGWEIDVRSKESIEAAIKTIGKMKSLGKKGTESVVESGYNSIEAIAKTTEEKLAKIKGISSNKAKQIIEEAKELIENTKNKED